MSWISGNRPPAEAPEVSYINGKTLNHGQEIAEIRYRNDNFVAVLNQDNGMANPHIENPSRTKRRKLKSKVWDEFTKYEGEDGKEWAVCHHCKNKFVGSSKNGTTHLKNHLKRCRSEKDPDRGIDDFLTSSDIIIKAGKSKVDQELNQLDKTRMIIQYWIPSLESIRYEIFRVYGEEKDKLHKYFDTLACRFSLTVKWFYHGQFFMVLHFIDDNWELQKKIFYFQCEEDRDFIESLKRSLIKWKLDKNICSIVSTNNLSGTEEFIEIDKWLSQRGSLPFAGTFFSIDWLVYRLRMSDWKHLKWEMSNLFLKMLELSDYIRKTSSKIYLRIAVSKAKFMGKKVTSKSVPTTFLWDFELLEWVMGFKEAFFELEQIDPAFKLMNLTTDEWEKAIALHETWKVLEGCANSLSERKYTTTNVHCPKVGETFMKLILWGKSDNYYLREIASRVREKFFDKYWHNSNLIMIITGILDPRFKMSIVESLYKEIYGSDADTHLKKIINLFINVYNEYAKGQNNSKTSTSDNGDGNSLDSYQMPDNMVRPWTSFHQIDDTASPHSELERYFKDSKFPEVEEFDILAWWHNKSTTFPTLSKMARDFLAIPISTNDDIVDVSLVTEIRDIIRHKDLDIGIKQALVHTKIWLCIPQKNNL